MVAKEIEVEVIDDYFACENVFADIDKASKVAFSIEEENKEMTKQLDQIKARNEKTISQYL